MPERIAFAFNKMMGSKNALKSSDITPTVNPNKEVIDALDKTQAFLGGSKSLLFDVRKGVNAPYGATPIDGIELVRNMIKMSMIPCGDTGFDDSGNIVFDPAEGMSYKKMMTLSEQGVFFFVAKVGAMKYVIGCI